MSLFTDARDAFTQATGLNKVTATSAGTQLGGVVNNVIRPTPMVPKSQDERELSAGFITMPGAPVLAGVSMPILLGLGILAIVVFQKKGRR